MKELYGSAILLLYFVKWPFFLGFIYLYNNGLTQNYFLNFFWFVCLTLILKDLYFFIKRGFKFDTSCINK